MPRHGPERLLHGAARDPTGLDKVINQPRMQFGDPGTIHPANYPPNSFSAWPGMSLTR